MEVRLAHAPAPTRRSDSQGRPSVASRIRGSNGIFRPEPEQATLQRSRELHSRGRDCPIHCPKASPIGSSNNASRPGRSSTRCRCRPAPTRNGAGLTCAASSSTGSRSVQPAMPASVHSTALHLAPTPPTRCSSAMPTSARESCVSKDGAIAFTELRSPTPQPRA